MSESKHGTLFAAEPQRLDYMALEQIESFADPIFHVKNRAQAYAERAERGSDCWGFRVDGQVICYGWATMGAARVPLWRDFDICFDANWMYVWDCRTHDDSQRNGYFTRLLRNMLGLQSIRSVLIACHEGNPESADVIRKQFAPVRFYGLERRWRGWANRVDGKRGSAIHVLGRRTRDLAQAAVEVPVDLGNGTDLLRARL